ncbi:uncharacterized protein BO80DRAFT_468416 [Aspergillus ibericus CBS 121593]|uniref:Uncharacterized protein n=1 Tax=Aspergillus ibericus CBS 121593 TaxID=1448316 RepID=A0A395GM77_9EURO|nr:hypothetical protein BO80DRAFT_468416 [Aspergillus ibericus CBS 121593]RAK96620.1 hypothetical protein BO80DRAFT_468416 [Aspergillus ibericus CBS 121593]
MALLAVMTFRCSRCSQSYQQPGLFTRPSNSFPFSFILFASFISSSVPSAEFVRPFLIMAAIDLLAIEARHQVIKRSNWASENPGVVLVFCIVFIVAVGIIALFIYRKCMARKAAKQSYEVEQR